MVISQAFLSSIRHSWCRGLLVLRNQSFRISSRARVKGWDFLTAAPSFLKTMKNATQRANFGGSLRIEHAPVDITRNLCRRHPRWGKRVAAVSASSKWAQRLLWIHWMPCRYLPRKWLIFQSSQIQMSRRFGPWVRTWCWLLGRHWYFRSNVHLSLCHIT